MTSPRMEPVWSWRYGVGEEQNQSHRRMRARLNGAEGASGEITLFALHLPTPYQKNNIKNESREYHKLRFLILDPGRYPHPVMLSVT